MRTQPAGRGAAVDFRFRNGRRVHFEARELLHEKLLKDVKDYISLVAEAARLAAGRTSTTSATAWSAMNQQQYLGRPVADWDLDLDPLPRHFDRRITVTTPLQKAGAYLLTARMEGGNTSRIVVWLDDTVIIKKIARGQGVLLHRRRTHRPAGAAGRRRAVRLAFGAGGRTGMSSASRPGRSQSRADGEGQVQVPTVRDERREGILPVGRHRQHARRPPGASGLLVPSGAPAGTTPPMTR